MFAIISSSSRHIDQLWIGRGHELLWIDSGERAGQHTSKLGRTLDLISSDSSRT